MNLSKADNFPKSIYVIVFVFTRFSLNGYEGMEYREFGWTKVKVSSIGMGTYYDASYIVTSLLFHHQMGRKEKVAALKKGLDFKNVIVQCYQQMSAALQKEQGIELEDTMTAREFEHLLEAKGLPRDPVHQLTQLFEAARYSLQQFTPADEQKAFDCLSVIVQFSHERRPGLI